jgi:hypothetical protein
VSFLYGSGSQSAGRKRSSRGAQEVCREKKNKRNFPLAIFIVLYFAYIYHPVLITNFITLWIFF